MSAYMCCLSVTPAIMCCKSKFKVFLASPSEGCFVLCQCSQPVSELRPLNPARSSLEIVSVKHGPFFFFYVVFYPQACSLCTCKLMVGADVSVSRSQGLPSRDIPFPFPTMTPASTAGSRTVIAGSTTSTTSTKASVPVSAPAPSPAKSKSDDAADAEAEEESGDDEASSEP